MNINQSRPIEIQIDSNENAQENEQVFSNDSGAIQPQSSSTQVFGSPSAPELDRAQLCLRLARCYHLLSIAGKGKKDSIPVGKD